MLRGGIALDLTDVVDARPIESGLVGIALHPEFDSNHELYLSYLRGVDSGRISRISRVTSSDGGVTFDLASEEVILERRQIRDIHNNGHINFGPDGYL